MFSLLTTDVKAIFSYGVAGGRMCTVQAFSHILEKAAGRLLRAMVSRINSFASLAICGLI